MTKSEIRCLSVAKLRLQEDSLVYDVGAGTGSVSVEAALQTPKGRVWAVEKNREAAGLIRENARKFQVSHVEVVEGKHRRLLTPCLRRHTLLSAVPPET